MPAGRPRTVSLPPDEMIALGKEMIKWVKEKKPIHLSQWYCVEKGYTDKEFETMHVCQEFFPYYEQALKIIGVQYLTKDSPVEPNIKNRWQRVYYKDLKKQEDQDLDDAAIRAAKATEGPKVDEELLANFKAYMSQLKEAQDKSNA